MVEIDNYTKDSVVSQESYSVMLIDSPNYDQVLKHLSDDYVKIIMSEICRKHFE